MSQNNNFTQELLIWLSKLNSEKLPSDISAINIGMFESSDGYQLYLTGSKEYDAEDFDWATVIDFEPDHKYFPITEDLLNELGWQEFLNEVETALHEIKENSLDQTILSKVDNVTFGFDNGDLIKLI